MEDNLNFTTKDDFTKIVERKYNYHCKRTGQRPTMLGLLEYCISSGIIKSRTVAHYMTMELYPGALYECGHFTKAYEQISEATGLSEKTVRAMVRHPHRYTPQNSE